MGKKVKIGDYTYEKSNRKDKKLMTIVDGKKVHFGNVNYQHYRDKTGIWSNLDHLDKKRRYNYNKRHTSIVLKNGEKAVSNPKQPAWHALRILW